MSVSELDGDFASHTLTYKVKTGEVDPTTQRWVETGEETRSFRVWFKSTSSPQIIAQVGADVHSAAIRGRLLEPTEPPEGAVSGETYFLDSAEGEEEKARKIMLIWRLTSPIAEIDEALGRSFIGRLYG